MAGCQIGVRALWFAIAMPAGEPGGQSQRGLLYHPVASLSSPCQEWFEGIVYGIWMRNGRAPMHHLRKSNASNFCGLCCGQIDAVPPPGGRKASAGTTKHTSVIWKYATCV